MNIIYTGILTLLCMIVLHHIYNYLQSNLTIPKINDLVKCPEIKYREIHQILQSKPVQVNENYQNPYKEKEKEKDELAEYLKQFKTK